MVSPQEDRGYGTEGGVPADLAGLRYALFVALKTLHIVDGQSTGSSLRASGLAKSKDILRWMDALYSGPVPAGLSLKKLSEIRSRFWTNNKRSGDEFEKRNAQLLTYKEYDGVVLWFGPTLLCQLSLVQILTWFSRQRFRHPQLWLVTAYGGVLREPELREAHAARKPISAAQVRVATRFWNAFTSATPMALQRLLKSDLRALAEIRSTINELLQEYPSVQGGLSRLERKLLLEIDSIGASRAAFAVGSVNRREWILRHASSFCFRAESAAQPRRAV